MRRGCPWLALSVAINDVFLMPIIDINRRLGEDLKQAARKDGPGVCCVRVQQETRDRRARVERPCLQPLLGIKISLRKETEQSRTGYGSKELSSERQDRDAWSRIW